MSEEWLSQSDHTPAITPPLRRRPRRRAAVYTPIHRKTWVMLFCLTLWIGCGLSFYLQMRTEQYAVSLNGKVLLLMATRDGAEQAIRAVKSQLAPQYPDAVSFVQGEVEIRRVHSLGTIYSQEAAVNKLDAALTTQIKGVVIRVDGIPMVMLGSEQEAWQAISLMQQRALRGKRGNPTFKEEVLIRPKTITEGETSKIPIMTAEQAATELGHPPRARFHTVKRGESYYVIAQAYGVSVEVISQLNPNLDPGKLQPGDNVRLPDIQAPITIVIRPEA